jgi:hypothetical protein
VSAPAPAAVPIVETPARRALRGRASASDAAAMFSPSASARRAALYKTLHDARRKLRTHLRESGLTLDNFLKET